MEDYHTMAKVLFTNYDILLTLIDLVRTHAS